MYSNSFTSGSKNQSGKLFVKRNYSIVSLYLILIYAIKLDTAAAPVPVSKSRYQRPRCWPHPVHVVIAPHIDIKVSGVAHSRTQTSRRIHGSTRYKESGVWLVPLLWAFSTSTQHLSKLFWLWSTCTILTSTFNFALLYIYIYTLLSTKIANYSIISSISWQSSL